MTSICEKKISAEVWLIHAEQMSLYNFIVVIYLKTGYLNNPCFAQIIFSTLRIVWQKRDTCFKSSK